MSKNVKYTAAQKKRFAKMMTYKNFKKIMHNVPFENRFNFNNAIHSYSLAGYHKYEKDGQASEYEQKTYDIVGEMPKKQQQYFAKLSQNSNFQRNAYNFSELGNVYNTNLDTLSGIPKNERYHYMSALSNWGTANYFSGDGSSKDPGGKKMNKYIKAQNADLKQLSPDTQKKFKALINEKPSNSVVFSAKQYAFHNNPTYLKKHAQERQNYLNKKKQWQNKRSTAKKNFVKPSKSFFLKVAEPDRRNFAHVIADYNDFKYNQQQHNKAIQAGTDSKYLPRAKRHFNTFMNAYKNLSAPSQTQLNNLNITKMPSAKFTSLSKQSHHYINTHPKALDGITPSEKYAFGRTVDAAATIQYYKNGAKKGTDRAKQSIAKNTKVYNRYYNEMSFPNQVKFKNLTNDPQKLSQTKFAVQPYLRSAYFEHKRANRQATPSSKIASATHQTATKATPKKSTKKFNFLDKVPLKNRYTFAQAISDTDSYNYWNGKGNTTKAQKSLKYAGKALHYLPKNAKDYFNQIMDSNKNKYYKNDTYLASKYVQDNRKAHFARIKNMSEQKQASNSSQSDEKKFKFIDAVPKENRMDLANAISSASTAQYWKGKGNTAKQQRSQKYADKSAKYLPPKVKAYYQKLIDPSNKKLNSMGFLSYKYTKAHANDFKQQDEKRQQSPEGEQLKAQHKTILDKAQNPKTMAHMLSDFSKDRLATAHPKESSLSADQISQLNKNLANDKKTLSSKDQELWTNTVSIPFHNDKDLKHYQTMANNYLGKNNSQNQTTKKPSLKDKITNGIGKKGSFTHHPSDPKNKPKIKHIPKKQPKGPSKEEQREANQKKGPVPSDDLPF